MDHCGKHVVASWGGRLPETASCCTAAMNLWKPVQIPTRSVPQPCSLLGYLECGAWPSPARFGLSMLHHKQISSQAHTEYQMRTWLWKAAHVVLSVIGIATFLIGLAPFSITKMSLVVSRSTAIRLEEEADMAIHGPQAPCVRKQIARSSYLRVKQHGCDRGWYVTNMNTESDRCMHQGAV